MLSAAHRKLSDASQSGVQITNGVDVRDRGRVAAIEGALTPEMPVRPVLRNALVYNTNELLVTNNAAAEEIRQTLAHAFETPELMALKISNERRSAPYSPLPYLPSQAFDNALSQGAERLVGSNVCPDCASLIRIGTKTGLCGG